MRYSVNYQRIQKGDSRPAAEGETIKIANVSDAMGFLCVPNVGDFVHIDNTMSGRVKSKLFFYTGDTCRINIVVEEDPTIYWGGLIKEEAARV